MQDYGRVRDDGTVQIGLPSTGTLKNGTAVSGYDKLPPGKLKQEGWLPVEDEQEGDGAGDVTYRVEKTKIVRVRQQGESDSGAVDENGDPEPRGKTPGARVLRVSPQQIADARTLQELKDALLANDAPDHAFRS